MKTPTVWRLSRKVNDQCYTVYLLAGQKVQASYARLDRALKVVRRCNTLERELAQ